ncbi:hypothetical protein [uncultured Duncaniella sp.]|uniref:hypothetical protein n=1 Tax=uncultured Duncaniella sp. TaxID=2768039 RepID=UPI002732714D|nr:hypothetical protein [uncultured Duncaniella sp.]
MLHVAPGALRPVFEGFPTARLRDAHRAGAVDVIGGNDGWYRHVSHADMTLRLRRWLHFKIISALLTVFETMSENGDYANAQYSKPAAKSLNRCCFGR